MPKDLTRGLVASGRPANYIELVAAVDAGQVLGYAFAHFLDEFYVFRDGSFFDAEPPCSLTVKFRAYLAAVADFLCHEFSLPVPAWIDKPEYILGKEWDRVADDEMFPRELHARVDRRRERPPGSFSATT